MGHVIGYQTAFSEDIDLRKLPVGWAEAGYDDSGWQRPLVGSIPENYSLSPQPTPSVAVFKRQPERVVKKGEGHYFIDFGTELSGETVFLVSGAPGQEVEIRHGEELLAPGTVRYDMRCNCLYQEFCTLSGRPDETLEFFDYKGFRYVEVLNWPEELKPDRVWAHERHYPFPEDASSFASSNLLLNDIWRLCRNGVRVGTIDTYLDCPTREKGGFLGDGFVTGISHLILTGDARIMRKFLKDVANTSGYCPGLSSTAPNYINGELAEYSLLWPVLLEYYYQWTADATFVREMIPVLERQLAYFAAYENESGLLQDLYSHATGRYSVLVDWPKNLRDGYDDPYLMGDRKIEDDPQGVVNTMVQGFYHGALLASGRLAKIADSADIQAFVSGRAERVRESVLARLRDPATGRFVDRNGSTHSALHANVTPLLSGMLSAEDAAPIVECIRQKRLSCGVYFSFFVLKALYDMGESELAYDIMTGTDLHSWHSMLQAGATTCMEAWAPDLKWNTSWCHPWSSAPIAMIAHEVMGVSPELPGWKTIRFAPRPPTGLGSAAIRLRIPQGEVEASFQQDDGMIEYRLTVPPGCTVRCLLPAGTRRVDVDGVKTDCLEHPEARGMIRMALPRGLAGGEHRIAVPKNDQPKVQAHGR
ncbi:MAG: family 78 glycoside hydrolase catalytic domain [Lentisphaeria bacterium]|nr:family 78 glycoside hydrolase catalytic domain [Lentisphaeria bacterium]